MTVIATLKFPLAMATCHARLGLTALRHKVEVKTVQCGNKIEFELKLSIWENRTSISADQYSKKI